MSTNRQGMRVRHAEATTGAGSAGWDHDRQGSRQRGQVGLVLTREVAVLQQHLTRLKGANLHRSGQRLVHHAAGEPAGLLGPLVGGSVG